MLGPSATALDFHGVATLRNTATLLALKLSLIVPSLITSKPENKNFLSNVFRIKCPDDNYANVSIFFVIRLTHRE